MHISILFCINIVLFVLVGMKYVCDLGKVGVSCSVGVGYVNLILQRFLVCVDCVRIMCIIFSL